MVKSCYPEKIRAYAERLNRRIEDVFTRDEELRRLSPQEKTEIRDTANELAKQKLERKLRM